MLNSKKYQKFLFKIKEKFQTFHQEKYTYANCDVYYNIDWVYGIRIKDVKKIF